MFKSSRLFSNDIRRQSRTPQPYEKRDGFDDNTNYKIRSRQNTVLDIQNCSQQRFMEIKKKYGIKDRLVTEPCQSGGLRDLSLNHENYSTFKNADLDDKSKSKYRSPIGYKQTLKYQSKTEFKKQIKQSIGKKTEQLKQIPRFGGKVSQWDSINSNKYQINKDERIGSLDDINARIQKMLNFHHNNSSKKRQQILLNKYQQNTKHQSFHSQIKKNAFNKYYVPAKRQRKVESIDSKVRRYSANYQAIERQRPKTPHLLQQSKRSKKQDTSRSINFDQEFKKIEDKIKKRNDQKKKLDIFQYNQKYQELPQRILDHSKTQQRSTILMQRRNRVYSNNISSLKLKTQQQQNSSIVSKINPGQKSYTQNQTKTKVVIQRSQLLQQKKQSSNLSSYRQRQDRKKQLNLLVQSLKIQVQLDESLRNSKVSSQSLLINNKHSFIKQSLEKQGIILSQSKIKQQFQATEQEHNPFFSVRQCSKSLNDVIDKYIKSYTHWTTNICHKFNFHSLTKQGFCQQNIDLTKKGEISIEDLVRFLNFETKNFYRNRDMILIWKRITKKKNIMFKELVEVICQV